MARDWEAQFRDWAKPPGKTEEDRCENAVAAIRNAIDESPSLQTRSVQILLQGSYANNTNVRKDSDVDIGVVCKDSFFYRLPENTTEQTFGISPASYHYPQFKADLEEALVDYFGRGAVTRGNKAFDLHETTYHVEADVAPFFEHRRYRMDKTFLPGVELYPDDASKRIVNWPNQHYESGCKKNNDTGKRFKAIVRVLKALSVEMVGAGKAVADLPGFLVECMVWNVPNTSFQHADYADDLKSVLLFLYNSTKDENSCHDWTEVSELKYLSRPSQKWTLQQANAFTMAAWNHIGLWK